MRPHDGGNKVLKDDYYRGDLPWNLEGLTVRGSYMGEFPVSGTVELSRVKYGGGVCHHIKLDECVNVYGATRDRVILNHSEINQVFSTR